MRPLRPSTSAPAAGVVAFAHFLPSCSANSARWAAPAKRRNGTISLRERYGGHGSVFYARCDTYLRCRWTAADVPAGGRIILVWAVTGPIFHFSDTWQLIINTGTTIVTFLMVFLIQNAQNRDAAAMQAKLDELLRAVGKRARPVHRRGAFDRARDRDDPRALEREARRDQQDEERRERHCRPAA